MERKKEMYFNFNLILHVFCMFEDLFLINRGVIQV